MRDHKWVEKTLEASSDIWDKKEPLEGKLVKTETNVGPHESNLYTFELDDKTSLKAWGNTVLDDKLLGVPNGTYVRLEYEGLIKGKKSSYHSYKVFIDLDSTPDDVPDDDPNYQSEEEQAQQLNEIFPPEKD